MVPCGGCRESRVGVALVTCLHSRSRSASSLSVSVSLSLSVSVCLSLSLSLVEDLTVVNGEDEGLVELWVQATLNLN